MRTLPLDRPFAEAELELTNVGAEVRPPILTARRAACRNSVEESKRREITVRDSGDNRIRAEAKLRFAAGDWNKVVALLQSLRYPDQMDVGDRKRLDMARRRAAGR